MIRTSDEMTQISIIFLLLMPWIRLMTIVLLYLWYNLLIRNYWIGKKTVVKKNVVTFFEAAIFGAQFILKILRGSIPDKRHSALMFNKCTLEKIEKNMGIFFIDKFCCLLWNLFKSCDKTTVLPRNAVKQLRKNIILITITEL